MTEYLIKFIDKKSIGLRLLLSVICYNFILLVGLLDYNIASINIFIFYAFSVVFASLFLSTADGIVASVLSASLNFFTNTKFLTYNSITILIFNFIVDLSLFILIVILVVQLRKAFLREKKLARTDFLTGLKNRRSFLEELTEKNAAFSNEYSLCYMDIDRYYNFIENYGIVKADEMIKMTSRFLMKYYENIYRYEENRFIIIFNETDTKKSAFSKMQILNNELQTELERHGLPVSFSVGILYVTRGGLKISQILFTLFRLVQSIKKEGGNMVKYSILDNFQKEIK